jgi:hypothetical protein
MDVREIIKELEKTKDDNRRFALLLIIAQLIKKDQLDDLKESSELSARLFHSITPHFLARLITSNQQAPENCPKQIFKSIGFSILVQFAEYEDLVCDPIIISKIKQIFETLQKSIETIGAKTDDDDIKLELDMLDNIFKYLFALSKYCANHLCKNNLLDVLLHNILLNEQLNKTHSKYVDIGIQLTSTLVAFDTTSNHECLELLSKFLRNFVQSTDANQTEFKFELIKILNRLLSDWPNCSVYFETISKDVSKNFLSILNDTLQSRIKTTYKHQSFILLDFYAENYGLESMYRPSREFFHLTVHLVSIEIRLGLEDNTKSLSEMFKDTELVGRMTVYFNLFEKFIIFLSTSDCIDENANHEQLNKMTNVFMETVKSLLDFLNDCLKEKLTEGLEQNLFLLASIRILGCWFAYEDLLENEIIQFISGFVGFFKAHKLVSESDRAFFTDLSKFLIPGLERYLDNNKSEPEAVDDDATVAELRERIQTVRETVKVFDENT